MEACIWLHGVLLKLSLCVHKLKAMYVLYVPGLREQPSDCLHRHGPRAGALRVILQIQEIVGEKRRVNHVDGTHDDVEVVLPSRVQRDLLCLVALQCNQQRRKRMGGF